MNSGGSPAKPFAAAGAAGAPATAGAAGATGTVALTGAAAFGNRPAKGLPAGISDTRSPGKLTCCGSGSDPPGTWGSDTSAVGIKPCAGAGAAAATGAAAASGAAGAAGA